VADYYRWPSLGKPARHELKVWERKMRLQGSCECGAVRFSVSSGAPYPYRICYCRRCRKIAGGTGAAVNILANAGSLELQGQLSPTRYQRGTDAPITSFCPRCGSALLVELPAWPQWIYPFASAIDTPLPVPPHFIHIQVADRPEWVPIHGSAEDPTFITNTEESIIAWHDRLGLASVE
jgi:hypothetical protein